MATPTLVQHVEGGIENIPGATTLTVPFPNPVLSGNFLMLFLSFDSSLSISSVKDSANNNFTQVDTATNAGNNLILRSYYIANNTSSPTNLVVTYSGTTSGRPARLNFHFSEWYNVATSSPVDVHGINASSKSSGSMTTTVGGDLILQYGIDISDNASIATAPLFQGTSITAGASFTLLAGDLNIGMCVQYQVQASAGAINPTFTTSGAATWGSVGIALFSATAGTAPSSTAMRVVGVLHTNYTTSASTSAIANQFPCQGNLLVMCTTPFGAWQISSVSDTGSNSWKCWTGLQATISSPVTDSSIVFAPNATPSSTLSVTITWSSTPTTAGNAVVFYDVVNAATSPCAGAVSVTGNQTIAGNLSALTITPVNANGLVIAVMGVEYQTLTGLTTTGGIFDSAVNGFDDNAPGGTSPSTLDEDNAFAHVYPSSTSAITFTWTYYNGKATSPTSLGLWACVAVSFNASGQTGGQPVMVQGPVTADPGGSVSTITIAYPAAVKAGNLLLCHYTDGGTFASPAVSDSVNGNWPTPAINVLSSGGNRAAICDFPNTASGTPTVTVHLTAAHTFQEASIEEWTNVPTSGVIGQTNSGTGSSTTPSSGATGTLNSAYSTVIGVATVANSISAGLSTWSVYITPNGNSREYTSPGSTSSQTATWTEPTGDWAAVIAEIIGVAPGGSTNLGSLTMGAHAGLQLAKLYAALSFVSGTNPVWDSSVDTWDSMTAAWDGNQGAVWNSATVTWDDSVATWDSYGATGSVFGARSGLSTVNMYQYIALANAIATWDSNRFTWDDAVAQWDANYPVVWDSNIIPWNSPADVWDSIFQGPLTMGAVSGLGSPLTTLQLYQVSTATMGARAGLSASQLSVNLFATLGARAGLQLAKLYAALFATLGAHAGLQVAKISVNLSDTMGAHAGLSTAKLDAALSDTMGAHAGLASAKVYVALFDTMGAHAGLSTANLSGGASGNLGSMTMGAHAGLQLAKLYAALLATFGAHSGLSTAKIYSGLTSTFGARAGLSATKLYAAIRSTIGSHAGLSNAQLDAALRTTLGARSGLSQVTLLNPVLGPVIVGARSGLSLSKLYAGLRSSLGARSGLSQAQIEVAMSGRVGSHAGLSSAALSLLVLYFPGSPSVLVILNPSGNSSILNPVGTVSISSGFGA